MMDYLLGFMGALALFFLCLALWAVIVGSAIALWQALEVLVP